MVLREIDPYNVVVDSVWKYVSVYKSAVDNPDTNNDFRVVLASRDSIRFGRIRSNGEAQADHQHRRMEFIKSAVPLREDAVKDKTRFAALVSQIRNCKDSSSEIYDMLVELEI